MFCLFFLLLRDFLLSFPFQLLLGSLPPFWRKPSLFEQNTIFSKNLKQNEAQSAHAKSTHKGDNQRSKYVTRIQRQRPESPTVTLTWHACKYKVHKLHQRYSSIFSTWTLSWCRKSLPLDSRILAMYLIQMPSERTFIVPFTQRFWSNFIASDIRHLKVQWQCREDHKSLTHVVLVER